MGYKAWVGVLCTLIRFLWKMCVQAVQLLSIPFIKLVHSMGRSKTREGAKLNSSKLLPFGLNHELTGAQHIAGRSISNNAPVFHCVVCCANCKRI